MSEFIAEGLVDGQRVIMVKSVDGTIEQTNAFLAEVLVDDGSGHLQRCIAVKDLGGGSGGASALSDLSDVDLSGLEDGQCLIYDSESGKWVNGTIEVLPDQTGNAGKSLYTDGTDALWKVTRDPNTYRSLSSAQAETLLDNGTYNDEEVTSGEIFTCADGAIKKYVKEDLGVGIDASDYTDTRIPCNKTVIENGVSVLYATVGTDTTTFLRSTDYGKTWTSVASNRGSLSCYKQRMFYENGVFYVMRTTDGSNMYLDVSTDNMQTWNTYSVGSSGSTWTNTPCYYLVVNSAYIIVGSSYPGYYRQFRAPLSDLSSFTEVSDYSIRQVYVFNDLFVCESKYSSDASTWTNNNMPSTREGVFFKNNKMYVQNNSTPAVLYESSDGRAFTSVGTYSGANSFSSYATFDTIDEVYAYSQASPQVFYSTKSDLLNWTKISDDFMRSGQYCDLWFVSPDICFEISQNSDTRRGVAGVQYNRSLDVLLKLTEIAEAGEGIKILPPYNFEIVGNPTLVDKVLSNITQNDYLKFVLPSETFSVGGSSWKVKAKVRTPSNVTTEATFFNNPVDQEGFRVGITSDGKWQFLVSNNGWIDTSNYYGTYSVQGDTDYWLEFGYDTDYYNYYLKYSTDGQNYSNDITYNSYIGMMDTAIYLLSGWTGLVYLEDVSVEKGGSVWTTPYSDSTKDKIAVDILTPSSAPDSSLDGFAGQIAIYNGNAYICVDSSNTWKQFTS